MRTSVWLALVGMWVGCGDDTSARDSATKLVLMPTDAGPQDSATKDSNVDESDTGADDEDGGGAAASNCEDVEAVAVLGEDLAGNGPINATVSPKDFAVTRVALGWAGGCKTPSLVLEQSGGHCPTGNPHALTMTLDTQAISSGLIHIGDNTLDADNSQGITVRYARPASAIDHGVWGTCAGVTGTITLLETPKLIAKHVLAGSYTMTLTPCDETTKDTQELTGTFATELGASLDEACP